MSRFYSSIQGQRGEATRCGHSSIRASAQSYDGSIIVTLFVDEVGEVWAAIYAAAGSSTRGGHALYHGPIKDLLGPEGRHAIVRKFASDMLEAEFMTEPRTAAGSLD